MMPTHDQSQPSSYAAFAPNVNAAAAAGAGAAAGNGAPNVMSAAGVVGGAAAQGNAVGVSVGAGAGNAAGPRAGAAGSQQPPNNGVPSQAGAPAPQQMLLPSGVVMQPLPGMYPSDGSAPASAFGGLPQQHHMQHPDAGATNSPQLSGPQGAPQGGSFGGYAAADPLRDVSTRVQPKATSEVKMSVRVLVESASAGRLIGKAGETVKKMREQSGAFIDIANSVRGATRRIVTVKGTPDPIAGALALMAEALAGAEDASKDHKSLFPGAAAGAGAKSEFQRPHPYQTGSAPGSTRPRAAADEFADNEEHGPAHSLVLLVHNAQVGCIIGRGGATVRETREASGAIINVSENMLEGSMEKTVTVKGAPANVRKALTLIVHQLAERQDRSTNHNLYTPRPQFDGPHGAAGAPAHHGGPSMGAPSGMGVNPAPSGAPNYGSVQYPDNAAANNSGAYPAYLGYSMPVQQPAVAPQAQPFSTVFPPSQPQAAPQAPTAMQQTVVVPVPDAMIGCVIGKRGQTVREIRQRSRATITIAELQPNQPDRMLTVTGTRQTIEIALALIYEKMHSFDPTKRGPPSAGAGAAPSANGHAGPAAAFPKSDH